MLRLITINECLYILFSGHTSLKWSPSTVEEKLVQYLDVDNGFDTSQLMEVRYWAKFKYRDESITTGQYKLFLYNFLNYINNIFRFQ